MFNWSFKRWIFSTPAYQAYSFYPVWWTSKVVMGRDFAGVKSASPLTSLAFHMKTEAIDFQIDSLWTLSFINRLVYTSATRIPCCFFSSLRSRSWLACIFIGGSWSLMWDVRKVLDVVSNLTLNRLWIVCVWGSGVIVFRCALLKLALGQRCRAAEMSRALEIWIKQRRSN